MKNKTERDELIRLRQNRKLKSPRSHWPHSKRPKLSRFFTLIELLVVIAIISVLMTILLPALKKARDRTKEAACRSNLKQQALCAQMYGNDFDGWVMPHYAKDEDNKNRYYPWWMEHLGYVGEGTTVHYNEPLPDTIFRCPSQEMGVPPKPYSSVTSPIINYWYGTHMGINYLFQYGKRFIEVKRPGERCMIGDAGWAQASYISQSRPPFPRHGPRANISWLDMHVTGENEIPALVTDYFWGSGCD